MKLESSKNYVPAFALRINAGGRNQEARQVPLSYRITKKLFDIVVSILLLPVFIIGSLLLVVANPFLNRGPLFFIQSRMGRDCTRFNAIKFRTMTCTNEIVRGAHDPLEVNRITLLGGFLRKARLDEIPQIINVLRGEMSLIGPRPDSYDHATTYVELIPGYRERHDVLPGITGLAQTEVGYVHGVDGTRMKVAADLHYIQNQSVHLDSWIFWRTLQTVAGRAGA
ncbi:sugar transferase [Sulfitobacter sp. HGT1]|uniref:sugar transferase n=1 Tax=Sulfitobacter sp. HGT1 TaxID=2735435 RepID=UPI0020CBE21C|nr:sugar transferase [Sulfitobacter sp. HGT1]